MRKIVFYGAGLIAVYLVVSNATAGGRLIAAGSSGASQVIKTFQGR